MSDLLNDPLSKDAGRRAEQLEARREWAMAWMAGAVVKDFGGRNALPIPPLVAKRLLPEGFECEKLEPVLARTHPGWVPVSVDSQDGVYLVFVERTPTV